MKIIENDAIVASIVKNDYLFVEHKKFCPSKVFRAVWTEILEHLNSHQIHKVLIDSRNMGIIAPDDQRWFSEEIGLQVENRSKSPRTYGAFVFTENIFTQFSVKSILHNMSSANPNFNRNIRYFDDLSTARNWIESIS